MINYFDIIHRRPKNKIVLSHSLLIRFEISYLTGRRNYSIKKRIHTQDFPARWFEVLLWPRWEGYGLWRGGSVGGPRYSPHGMLRQPYFVSSRIHNCILGVLRRAGWRSLLHIKWRTHVQIRWYRYVNSREYNAIRFPVARHEVGLWKYDHR